MDMSAASSVESTAATATAVGGVDLIVLITIVATASLGLAMAVLVAIAIGPHLSDDWAERFPGATVDASQGGESGDAEGTGSG